MSENESTQRLVDQFMAMVKISSPSRQEGAFAAYLQQELQALGFSVEMDGAGDQAGGDTGNLIATLRGRTAHAGLNPERDINAIQVAARAIDRMRLLRIDTVTTANIGKIHGGSATNIVTDQVELTAEARSLENEKLDVQSAHRTACLDVAARLVEAIIERSPAFARSHD